MIPACDFVRCFGPCGDDSMCVLCIVSHHSFLCLTFGTEQCGCNINTLFYGHAAASQTMNICKVEGLEAQARR